MSTPASRQDFILWIKRKLGWPVLMINLDDSQIDDCIDEALNYFHEFSEDGIERTWLKHQITDTDKTNQYFPVSSDVIGISRIFPLNAPAQTMSMFDLRYQLRLNELYDFTSSSYSNYFLTMQHIRTLEMLFTGDIPIRFNKYVGRVYLDTDWTQFNAGEYVVAEARVVVDPDTYNTMWNDRLFKKLATQYVKKVWGETMKRYSNVQLPGGGTLNGQQMYDEASQEIPLIEQEIRDTHELGLGFMVG